MRGHRVAARLGVRRVGVFGEVHGEGAPDLSYGADGRRDTLGCAVSAGTGGRVRWLNAAGLLEGRLPPAPRPSAGPYGSGRVLEPAGRRRRAGSRRSGRAW